MIVLRCSQWCDACGNLMCQMKIYDLSRRLLCDQKNNARQIHMNLWRSVQLWWTVSHDISWPIANYHASVANLVTTVFQKETFWADLTSSPLTRVADISQWKSSCGCGSLDRLLIGRGELRHAQPTNQQPDRNTNGLWLRIPNDQSLITIDILLLFLC